jgi:hypothetical protein
LRSWEGFQSCKRFIKNRCDKPLADSNPFLKNRLHNVGQGAMPVRKNAYAGLAILAVGPQNGDFQSQHLCI